MPKEPNTKTLLFPAGIKFTRNFDTGEFIIRSSDKGIFVYRNFKRLAFYTDKKDIIDFELSIYIDDKKVWNSELKCDGVENNIDDLLDKIEHYLI